MRVILKGALLASLLTPLFGASISTHVRLSVDARDPFTGERWERIVDVRENPFSYSMGVPFPPMVGGAGGGASARYGAVTAFASAASIASQGGGANTTAMFDDSLLIHQGPGSGGFVQLEVGCGASVSSGASVSGSGDLAGELFYCDEINSGAQQTIVAPFLYDVPIDLSMQVSARAFGFGHSGSGGSISLWVQGISLLDENSNPLSDYRYFTESGEYYGLDAASFQTPEPSTVVLTLAGLGALAFRGRRFIRK
jgi:hypothetical protein